jgi:catechol 2,3-dioxygenase-like lactoylglutathione lyase family enzyme
MTHQPKAEANVQQAVPFFAVSDMQASLRFYVNGMGFCMTKQWVEGAKLRWCWLDLGGAALMLQEYRREGHNAWVPTGALGEGVSICFIARTP